MKPNSTFIDMPKSFWAAVRTVSQQVGYTIRGKGQVRVPELHEIESAFQDLGLDTSAILNSGNPTSLARDLVAYFSYRAEVLNDYVEPRLMDVSRASDVFRDLVSRLDPSCPMPMNKQKGEKRAPAYLTCIVNMLVEAGTEGFHCDYDPRELTTVTRNGTPLRTMARRVDGAFPQAVNPIAIWEIKEYYYTTTFGSRVADGVYETLLDGMELEELREHEGVKVHHYLIVDAYYTWWVSGKSYLCRIIDMLHMGYVDEVLFGYEVVERLPEIISGWIAAAEGNRDFQR